MLVDAAEGTKPQNGSCFARRWSGSCNRSSSSTRSTSRTPVRRKCCRKRSTCSSNLAPTTRCSTSRTSSPVDALASPRTIPRFSATRSIRCSTGPRQDSRPGYRSGQPVRMVVTSLTWSEFVGRVVTGRVASGTVKKGMRSSSSKADGSVQKGNVAEVEAFDKLGRVAVGEGTAGDIVALTGLPDPRSATPSPTPRCPSRLNGSKSTNRRCRCCSRSTTRRWPAGTASSSPAATSVSG